MSPAANAPVDLYIATYPNPDAARGDWKTIKQLAKDDVIKVDGLVLVSRHADGKIHVDDDFHETRKGAVWGAVGGAVVGLICARPTDARACTTASSVDFSNCAAPWTVATRLGTRSARRWY